MHTGVNPPSPLAWGGGGKTPRNGVRYVRFRGPSRQLMGPNTSHAWETFFPPSLLAFRPGWITYPIKRTVRTHARLWESPFGGIGRRLGSTTHYISTISSQFRGTRPPCTLLLQTAPSPPLNLRLDSSLGFQEFCCGGNVKSM